MLNNNIAMNNIEVEEDLSWLFEDDEEDTLETVYADELDRPIGFDNIELQHGLMAFSGTLAVEGIANNMNTIIEHSEYQICTSTSYIGYIGITIVGDVLVAANIDINSRIGENNRRVFDIDDYRRSMLVHHIDELKDMNQHNEIIVTNTKAKGIWVKEYAETEIKELAYRLGSIYGLNINIIK